jgi:hypothetical protein
MGFYPYFVSCGIASARRGQIGSRFVSKGIRVDGAIVIEIFVLFGRRRRRRGTVRIIGCILILVVVVIIIIPAFNHYGGLYINRRVSIRVIIRVVRITVWVAITETKAAVVSEAQA